MNVVIAVAVLIATVVMIMVVYEGMRSCNILIITKLCLNVRKIKIRKIFEPARKPTCRFSTTHNNCACPLSLLMICAKPAVPSS